jgi:glucose-1-phosphate thymidylyltransferase
VDFKQPKMALKGIILCGGYGTRLRPLTYTTNKHLLPIYDRQMAWYPYDTLVKSGCDEVLIVSHNPFIDDFKNVFGMKAKYAVQASPTGIADSLNVAKGFIGDSVDPFIVLLGDNIFQNTLDFPIRKGRAKVFLKTVDDPERYGIAMIKGKKLKKIVEKPKKKIGNLAVVGAYVYDKEVFKVISKMKPSSRNELEITDVNNWYASKGLLEYEKLEGYWNDAGTFDSLLESSIWAKNNSKGLI